MEFFLILLMIIIYTLQSAFVKLYSDNYPGEASMASPLFSAVSGLAVALVGMIVGIAMLAISIISIPLSIMFSGFFGVLGILPALFGM